MKTNNIPPETIQNSIDEFCYRLGACQAESGWRIFKIYHSQAAIKALSSYVIDSKMIWECRNKLNEVGKKNKVFLIWVPGHSGIKGNEEVNTLAKEGARMSLIGPEPSCGISKCTYKKEFLEKEKAEREKLWRNVPGMDHSAEFRRNFETAGSKKYLDLGKKQLHLLTGFFTGHCRLRKHLLRMGLSDADECRFCGEEEETPIHLVTESLGIASLRKECLGRETCKSEEPASLKPSQLLDFIRSMELEGEL